MRLAEPASNVKKTSVSAGHGVVVGLPGLEPGTSSLSVTHGPGGPPWRMKTAARQGPWAVHCSAEGASAASTVSVTCEFALATGRFQPSNPGLNAMRTGVFPGRSRASGAKLSAVREPDQRAANSERSSNIQVPGSKDSLPWRRSGQADAERAAAGWYGGRIGVSGVRSPPEGDPQPAARSRPHQRHDHAGGAHHNQERAGPARRGRLRAGGLLAGGAGTAWCLRASSRSTACPGELVGHAGVGGAGRNQDAERD
jgi:hypothetical protein